MQTSSFFHPLKTIGVPFSSTTQQPDTIILSGHKRPIITMAFKKDGKMVDENMIVLRERIQKLKAETECGIGDDRVPENWMQWEKTYVYSGCYHSDVYQVVACLQRFLGETRPSVALGLVALFIVGGSMATVTVLHLLVSTVQAYQS